ncbi:MAG: ClbS/DfsB family four-helix bundle protein [Pseudomonadota bacterium]
MPAATDKAALLAIIDREYDKLTDVIESVPPGLASVKDDEDVSIKDVIGHRAHWIDLFLGWVADGAAGREVHIPARGVKWSELGAYNAKLRAEQSSLKWHEARAMLANRHARLRQCVEQMEDEALYGGPMPGHGKWTTGRFAESAGPSHYRSAVKYLRARLRQAQSD